MSSCGLCLQDVCGGDYTCSLSGQCVPLTCRIEGVQNVAVGDCADGLPYRCENVNGHGVARKDVSCNGCPDGYQPSDDGKTCQACATVDCGEIASTSCTSQSGTVSSGSCYPAAEHTTAGIRYSCVNKRKVASYQQCGCGEGFQHLIDGNGCIPESPPQERQGSQSFQESCPGCTESDELYYQPSTNSLETATGSTEYAFIADSVFPADAMPFALRPTGSTLSIGLGKVESLTGTANCYKYDAPNGIILFSAKSSAFPTCPIINYGNSFYLNGKKISSDSAKFVFKTSSLPPSIKDLTVTVTFRDVSDGLRVLPEQLSGPNTPQLSFLINQRPASFGPRVIKRSSIQTPYNDALTAIAWRGTGSLPLFEDVEPIATLSYSETPSYFECTGQLGLRTESCTDAFCCAGAWCDPTNVENAVNHFRSYAADLSASTAFRRGNGEPYKSLSSYYSAPIEVHVPIQLVEKALPSLRASGFTVSGVPQTCNADNPGVYDAVASTSDGETWTYSAKLLSIKRYGYLDDSCGAEQESDASLADSDVASKPLCNFLYGDCSCIASTEDNSLASNSQAKDPGPLQIDSIFMGFPFPYPYNGPAGLIGSHFLSGSSVAGQIPVASLLAPLLYYQPVGCKALDIAYKAAQRPTERACTFNPWATYKFTPAPLVAMGEFPQYIEVAPVTGPVENSMSILPALNACETTQPITACTETVTAAITTERTGTITSQIDAYNATGVANCKAALPLCAVACVPACPTTMVDTGGCLTACKSSCVAQAKGCGLEVPIVAGAPALAEANVKLSACQAAAAAEISAGNRCEATKSKLMDLPNILPIPRYSWSTCYAYSDACVPVCAPKKAYLLMIPLGKRIIILNHFGLNEKCEVVPPSLFGSFLKTDVNDRFSQYALYAGQSMFTSSFKGANYIAAGASAYGAIQALSGSQACPMPTVKPPTDPYADARACVSVADPLEKSVEKPGTLTGGTPATSGASSDPGNMDGSGFGPNGPVPNDGVSGTGCTGAGGESIPCQ